RLSESAIENINVTKVNLGPSAGLNKLIKLSNAEIDRICTQAAEFASDDHVDVLARQQLATLLFDNAEMRKQLNVFMEGVLERASAPSLPMLKSSVFLNEPSVSQDFVM
ncbi:MAG: hypothetical protein SGPRY_013851, partial [Prymnesium sp.]